MTRRLATLAAAAVVAVACGGSSPGSTSGSSAKATVFAASSLTDVFTAVGSSYETSTHGSVTFSFAGSQQLVAQIQSGAPADVIATADTKNMDKVASKLVSPAKVFASNRLVIAVPHGNPKHIGSVADLARRAVAVVLAAPTVPAGSYAATAIADAKVTVHPKSLEDNVRGVLTKVELGEADAGIVYATDVRSTNGKLDALSIPSAPTPIYEIGALKSAGQRFVDFVLSDDGQAVLRSFGFLPPP